MVRSVLVVIVVSVAVEASLPSVLVGSTASTVTGGVSHRLPPQLSMTLNSLGIYSDVFTAAGASQGDVREWRDSLGDPVISASLTSVSSARVALHDLRSQQGVSSAGVHQSIRDRVEAVSDAEAAAVQLLTESLSDPVRSRVRAILANRARRVPLPLRIVMRSEEDWLRISEAMASIRTAERRQHEVPAVVTHFIASVQNEGEAYAARLRLDLAGHADRNAWRALFGNEPE